MKIKNNFRKQTYWLIDFIKGNVVKKNYDDIKFQYKNYNSIKSITKRNNDLQNLLNYAKKNINFYKNLTYPSELNSFPIINKSKINKNINDFIATGFNKKNLFPITTSGSTGTPFTVYRDINKIKRHQADNIFFQEMAGYHFGSKLFYLRVWNKVNKKSLLKRIFQNIEMVEISNLSDKNIKNFIDVVEKNNSKCSILSFASSLEIIARYIEKDNLRFKCKNVNSIITMSEPITTKAKTILEDFFLCPVVSRYSNMENGFIAQQERGKHYYRINHASFYIEILDIEKDKLVKPDTLGRIVVTDLFNYGMPLIRYDTGDLGMIKLDENNIPYLSGIEGRRVDSITNTKGQILSPHSITNTMWNFSDIKQFQFIQVSDKNYIIKLNIDDKKYHREKKLISELRYYLGTDASIKVEIVHEIPLLASGKRKKIVSLLK